MVKIEGPLPFKGHVIWLTAEQNGRSSGPPIASDRQDYAATAYVPPRTLTDGLASFVLRSSGAWTSPAEGRWLSVPNEGEQLVQPGSVIVITEGNRIVAYFHVHEINRELTALT
jgi:hypothetical protein